MKFAIIAICLVGAIAADHGKGNQSYDLKKIPGCENYDLVKNTNATTCCPSLPSIFNKASYEKCDVDCKGNYCCKKNCSLKQAGLLDASGKFDAAKAKTSIKSEIKNAQYPVDTIVDECVKRAPQDVADWRKNHPTKSSKKSESSSKNETCPNPENSAIPKCIRHEIIANCPDWVKSSECDGLMSFVKTCRDYPPRGNCGKKSNKMDSEAKKEKKN